jgi:hypothetical protein
MRLYAAFVGVERYARCSGPLRTPLVEAEWKVRIRTTIDTTRRSPVRWKLVVPALWHLMHFFRWVRWALSGVDWAFGWMEMS